MPNKPGTELISGTTEVVTEQKAVQLSTAETASLLGVYVCLPVSATGAIAAIGGSKAGTEAKKELGKEKGIIIEKKQAPVFIEVNSLAKVWVDVEKGKDFVTWVALVA